MSLQRTEAFQDVLVVDADVHPTYGSETIRRALADRMAEPYASYLDPDGGSPDEPYPQNGWPKTMGGNRSGSWLTELAGGDDLDELLGTGIDHPILNQIAGLDKVRETDRAMEEMRAANDVLIERYLDDHDDLFGLCNVAMRRPDRAAEEIDRVGDERGIVGVVFYPGAEYQKPLGDPRYDVVYEAMADNGLTPTYHAVDGSLPARGAPILHDFERFVSMHVVGFPLSAMVTLTSLIVQGVPEKFPDLDFVITEAGIGWIPYMVGRLNREVAWRKSEAPLLTKSPEAYVREGFYFGTQPMEEHEDPSHLRRTLEMVGADSLLFTSDYPHWDFDEPGTTDEVLRRTFTPEERERVLGGNAVEAYDLPV